MTASALEMRSTEADALVRGREHFMRQFEQAIAAGELGANAGGPLLATRRAGMAEFANIGLPTVKSEEWKYTSLAPLAGVPFARPRLDGRPDLLPASKLAPGLAEAPHRVVFVNGLLDRTRSRLQSLPPGIAVMSLREAAAGAHRKLIEAHLGSVASPAGKPFVALNQALFEDGLLLLVDDGVTLDSPLLAMFATAAEEPVVSHVRNLVLLGRGSRVGLVEHYLSASRPALTNAVTEAVVGEGAELSHYKIEEESSAAFHVGSLHVRQERDSRSIMHVVATGGRIARSEAHVGLVAPGAACSLNGLYRPGPEQLIDIFTSVDHAEPNCTSEQLWKGVIGADSRAAWTGRVYVAKHAQQTNASQTDRNLLLAESAQVDARPQLEIYADDVKCSHGAAIGRLDDDALFYLRARGIDHDEARRLLTVAFAGDVLASMPHESVREALGPALGVGMAGELALGEQGG